MDIEGVREASKSSLEIDFRDHTGTRRKQRVKWDGSQRHKKDWFVKREAILSAIGNGQIPDYAAYFPRAKWAAKIVGAASYTVESALLDWLRRKSDEISPSTMEGYRRSVNTTIETFGNRTLDSIKWREVRDWLDSENRTQKRKSELLIPLRAIFARAYDDEDITKNPLEGRKPSGPSNPRAADPFELDEIKRFLDKVAQSQGRLFE